MMKLETRFVAGLRGKEPSFQLIVWKWNWTSHHTHSSFTATTAIY